MTKLIFWETHLCAFPCVRWQKIVSWNLDVYSFFILVVIATDSRLLYSNTRVCAVQTHLKTNHSFWSSLEFSLNAKVWLLLFELEGLDMGDGCYVRRDKTTNWTFFYRRLLPQGGLVCTALTECSRWNALTDAAEETHCGNELLIPEGRAGEIALIWTLLLWLIFVMQSYSVAEAHRRLWIMAPLLSARPRTPLIVLSRALQPYPGQQHTGKKTIIYLSLPWDRTTGTYTLL